MSVLTMITGCPFTTDSARIAPTMFGQTGPAKSWPLTALEDATVTAGGAVAIAAGAGGVGAAPLASLISPLVVPFTAASRLANASNAPWASGKFPSAMSDEIAPVLVGLGTGPAIAAARFAAGAARVARGGCDGNVVTGVVAWPDAALARRP